MRRMIEETFLDTLREDQGRDYLTGKIQDFKVWDWEELYEAVVKSGLFPAFYSRLREVGSGNIPAEFLSKLKDLYLTNLKRNIVLEKDLFDVLLHLKRSGIPAIPLKGPPLARYLYGDLALRQSSIDLDLLVKQEMAKEAAGRLEEVGYRFADPGNRRPDFFYRFRKQIPLKKEGSGPDGLLLELHWDFRDNFVATHVEGFWQNAGEVDLGGRRALMPANEDLLLYLALVATYDFSFIKIKYLYDIHRLIVKFGNNLGWDRVAQETNRHGLRAVIFIVLDLSRRLFSSDIPKDILAALRPSAIKERFLRRWINEKNILGFRENIPPAYTWTHIVTSYLYSKDILSCLRTICRKIFLPFDEIASYSLYIRRLLKPVNIYLK